MHTNIIQDPAAIEYRTGDVVVCITDQYRIGVVTSAFHNQLQCQTVVVQFANGTTAVHCALTVAKIVNSDDLTSIAAHSQMLRKGVNYED